MSENRNPFVIPDFDPTKTGPRVCPKCNSQNYTGNRKMDMIHYQCHDCGNVWGGGLPREPQDPRKPLPPVDPKDRPTVDFYVDRHTKKIEEIRRPVDLTQDFRRGALIPEDDDYNGW